MELNNNELCKQMELSPNIGLILLDKDYNITKVNSFITNSTNYDEAKLIGKNINFIISTHDYHDSFTNIIQGRLDKSEPLEFKHEVKKSNGDFFWSNINGHIYEDYSLWFIIPAKNINKKENAIKEIISSIYKKDDIPFMDAITLQIAKTLDADHVFVGEIQNTKLSVKTISHCMDKKIVDNFEYNLKNTPCELVHDGKASIFPQNVTSLFPKDQDLKDLGIEGYAGIPLFNDKNETLGLIVLLYRKPIKDPEFITSTISLFANIVANEYETQKAEKALNEQTVYYQSIIDGVKEPIMVIDKEYNIILMNKVAEQNKIYSKIKDQKHPKCYEVSHKQEHPCDGIKHPCPLKDVMETKQEVVIIHDHPDENGVSDYVELTATPLYDQNNNFIGIIESAKDITSEVHTREQLKEYKDKLHYEEHYNSLTKLPNRVLYYDRIRQAIKFANKNDNKFAIIFIDIDNFKAINDSLGIDAGNKVLKHVANQLKNNIKEGDSIAHFGADEFGIILQSITNTNEIIDYVDSVINMFKTPIVVESNKIYITVSIGISIYPDDNTQSDELIKFADSALHKAKTNGKNTYEFYTKDLTDEAYNRIVLENSLREAIPNNELVVYFQPKVDAKDGSIVGMEALVRWINKEGVIIPPNEFIPLAEEIRLISNIDIWMIDNVSKIVSSWYKKGLNPGVVSINITIQTLRMYGFKNLFMEILQENKCDPKYIELEITESQLMKNPEQTINILNDIKKMGIKISVDDFGTGYSSLAYLKKLPIDKLKIDKAFIDELPYDEEDVAISKTIISLAQSLKLDIIAEGVENKEQKDFLVENKCETIQGYFYHKPLPINEVEKLI